MEYSDILNFESLRYIPPIQNLTQNNEMKVIFNKFHRRINLIARRKKTAGSRSL
jgi:hypothetical protein